MKHRDLIAAIARRFPHRTRRDVEEVIDLLIELMQDELVRGESISLPDLGTLSIESQQVRVFGTVRQHVQKRYGPEVETVTRIYGRFRPAQALKDRLNKETRP